MYVCTVLSAYLHTNVVPEREPVSSQDKRLIHSVLWWRHDVECADPKQQYMILSFSDLSDQNMKIRVYSIGIFVKLT